MALTTEASGVFAEVMATLLIPLTLEARNFNPKDYKWVAALIGYVIYVSIMCFALWGTVKGSAVPYDYLIIFSPPVILAVLGILFFLDWRRKL